MGLGLGPVGGDAGRQGFRVGPLVDGLDFIVVLTGVVFGHDLVDLLAQKARIGVPPLDLGLRHDRSRQQDKSEEQDNHTAYKKLLRSYHDVTSREF